MSRSGVEGTTRRLIAQYTVRDGTLAAVQEAIDRFVAEVRTHEPRTVYDAYRLADSRSFIHFMAFEDDAAEEAHRRAAYTEAFVAALYPSCIEPPKFTELRPIG